MKIKTILITVIILSFFLLAGCTNHYSPSEKPEKTSDYKQIIELLDSIPTPNNYTVHYYQKGYFCESRYCGISKNISEKNITFKIKNKQIISEQKDITTQTIPLIISRVKNIVEKQKTMVDRPNLDSTLKLINSYEQDGCYNIKAMLYPNQDGPTKNHFIKLCFKNNRLIEVDEKNEIDLHNFGPEPDVNWRIMY